MPGSYGVRQLTSGYNVTLMASQHILCSPGLRLSGRMDQLLRIHCGSLHPPLRLQAMGINTATDSVSDPYMTDVELEKI
jgi:hypothetical protein